ncbi:MAG: hypothetical protein KVP17_000573 [Porospora cf. gigantea B]|uniref:uncharacterized protein n=2 Tax=Porospora cf. gigantea B TaxID=2853592 RepID=UPI003571BC48|nr:MAG: hypothetical protein KVP17_000573 [Porospora cf. gigantea B]
MHDRLLAYFALMNGSYNRVIHFEELIKLSWKVLVHKGVIRRQPLISASAKAPVHHVISLMLRDKVGSVLLDDGLHGHVVEVRDIATKFVEMHATVTSEAESGIVEAFLETSVEALGAHHEAHCVPYDTPLMDVCKTFERHSRVVLTKQGVAVGVFSISDFMMLLRYHPDFKHDFPILPSQKVEGHDDLLGIKCSVFLGNEEVVTVQDESPLIDTLTLMVEKGVSGVPVVSNGVPVSVVSLRDFMFYLREAYEYLQNADERVSDSSMTSERRNSTGSESGLPSVLQNSTIRFISAVRQRDLQARVPMIDEHTDATIASALSKMMACQIHRVALTELKSGRTELRGIITISDIGKAVARTMSGLEP